ncbi:MAG: SDR family oxidoreductase [Hyphomicrobiales bacterium]|nr:SDR family oxidoreductase [Hyphomicrobiales bacterium]
MATWLITGANRGIGLGLTGKLLARGESVIACAREPLKAEALAGQKDRHGDRLTILGLDVTSGESVEAAARASAVPIDVLINNAGIYGPRAGQGALDMDFGAFAEVLAVNTLGPLRVAQAFLPRLEVAGGKIVTVTSRMGSLAGTNDGAVAYRASKAAVNKVMTGLAQALRPRRIPVLLVHPGWVQTDMGGGGADITIAQSTDGIITLADRLDMSLSGQFMNYDGAPIAW